MKVIMATGGTGGHLFPALWTADEIEKAGYDVLFVGSFSVAKAQIENKFYRYINLKAKGMRFKGIWDTVLSLWLMAVAFVRSIGIVLKERPKVVIGFGGYGAFPVVLAAKLCGVPVLILEQNVIPGKANAFLGKIADKIALSFERTKEYFPKAKVVVTGCPCLPISKEKDVPAALKFFGFREKKFTLFVFGGSQGSQKINEVFMRVLSSLIHIKDFQVIHVTGPENFDMIKEEYESLGIPYALYSFLEEMGYAYALADMIIARSGAATIAEIIQAKVPSILIPYPFATQGHQKLNAEILSERDLAILIEQDQFNAQSLEDAILQNFEKIQSVKNMDAIFKDISYTDASKRLAQEALNLCKRG